MTKEINRIPADGRVISKQENAKIYNALRISPNEIIIDSVDVNKCYYHSTHNIAKLQDEYETAQISATRARNIGKKYLKALYEIEDIIWKTLSIGGLPLPEEDGEKILDIIAKAKG